LGIWSSLIYFVGQLLEFLYGFTHNYGLAIILLTIIIRVLLYPLMQKQMTSMRETQKIQPLMQEIQRKYKNDKERMNQELMRLYKEHKVNPMGGCLPLIIQMPILILFFQALREFEYFIPNTMIKDGGFLWIQNEVMYQDKMIAGLAAPDKLFWIVPATVPLIGGTPIGILPFLVGASMYFQQKLTTPAIPANSQSDSSSNPAANTQKIMNTIMPIMITFISFSLPSGLSLYWFTSTLFGIGQQILINKKEPTIKQEADISKEKMEKEVKTIQNEEIINRPKEKEEEIPWIPGYEKTATNSNKKSAKQGKKKGKGKKN
jgi:YidC/Oxa1 family membrane protein insertase